MPTLTTGFRGWLPLSNLPNMLSSFMRNPLLNSHKPVKGNVANLPSPKSLHSCQIKRFKVHAVKPVAQRISKLVEPISPTVCDSFVCFAQATLCLSAVVATFLFAGQFSVSLSDFRHTCLKELRTFDGSSRRNNRDVREAFKLDGGISFILQNGRL